MLEASARQSLTQLGRMDSTHRCQWINPTKWNARTLGIKKLIRFPTGYAYGEKEAINGSKEIVSPYFTFYMNPPKWLFGCWIWVSIIWLMSLLSFHRVELPFVAESLYLQVCTWLFPMATALQGREPLLGRPISHFCSRQLVYPWKRGMVVRTT